MSGETSANKPSQVPVFHVTAGAMKHKEASFSFAFRTRMDLRSGWCDVGAGSDQAGEGILYDRVITIYPFELMASVFCRKARNFGMNVNCL